MPQNTLIRTPQGQCPAAVITVQNGGYGRLHHGPRPHQVIALAVTVQFGMTVAGRIRLAVVTCGRTLR